MNPAAQAALWLASTIVCSFLAYRQGRQDEELRWRRVLEPFERRIRQHETKP